MSTTRSSAPGEAQDQRTRPVAPARSRQDGPGTAAGREPLRPAGERTGPGPVPVVGVLLSLLLLAAAVVLVRDALVVLGALGGTPWLEDVVGAVAGTAPATWMVPVGVALVLLGLYLLVVALGRRTRKELRLSSRTAVTLEPRGVARLSSAAAREVDGVVSARTSAGRRKLVVQVATTGDDGIEERVRSAVTDRVQGLQPTPAVRVRVQGGSR